MSAPKMAFGYVPPKEWLIKFAKARNLIQEDPKTSRERAEAMQEAVYQILTEADLWGSAEAILVDINDMPMYCIALATNWDDKQPTHGQVNRLKAILNINNEPSWRYTYSQ